MKFEKPTPSEVFSDFKDQVSKDKRTQLFPKELRPFLLKYQYLSSFSRAIGDGHKKVYTRRELNTILNPDLSRQAFYKLPSKTRQEIEGEFKNIVTMPSVLFSQKLNRRWVLTDRYSLVYNFWFLNNTTMSIIEILA
jgi:hypothetical protein